MALKPYLLPLALLLAGPAAAQTAPPLTADTLRILKAMTALQPQVSATPAQALPQARALLAQAQAQGYWRGVLLGYQLLRVSYAQLDQDDSAAVVTRLRLQTARAHQQLGTEAGALADLASIESQRGHYTEALALASTAEQLALTNPSRKWAARVRIQALNTVGGAYYAQGRLPEAIRAFGQAIRLHVATGQPAVVVAGQLSNLANIYQETGQLDSATAYARRALPLAQASQRPDVEVLARITLGEVALLRRNLPEAKAQFTQARDQAAAAGLKAPLAEAQAALGRLYLAQGRPAQALTALARAQAGADSARQLAQARSVAGSRAEVLAGLGRYREAYLAARQDQELTDSLAKINQTQALSAADRRLAEVQQQARLALLARENALMTAQSRLVAERNRLQQRLLWAGAAALLALAALVAVLLNRYRLKQRTAAALEIKNAEISKRDAEKATLLREMRHRVKNNLQVVSSLLSLQGRQLEDGGARDALRESKSRVEAMALLHQKLYQHEELRHIALPDYVGLLVATVLGTYGHDPAAVATVEVDDVAADIEVALPLGLLLNELLTNACKYALPHAAAPRLAIALRRDGPGLRLTVADNGPGLPPAPAAGAPAATPAQAARSFGQRLMGLLTEQLEGTLAWSVPPGGGAVAEVYVPATSLLVAG